jgi:crotonobetainyl-CoA:carnitine CoA-transferase CaiB-like acyl-CoA transferase
VAGDLIYSRINNIEDLENDPQVIANDYITEWNHPRFGRVKVPGFAVQFSETPQTLRLAAPELGEHTEEVLLEHGYTWDQLQEMKKEGAIV